jgi:hypothetical protein
MKKAKHWKREARIALACMFLLVMLVPQAQALLSISGVSQNSQVEYGSSQSVSANVISNASISHVLIEISGQNYTMQASGNVYSYSWVPNAFGINSYRIYLANAETEGLQYSNTFSVVDTTSPQLVASSPSGYINVNPVQLSITTSENAICKYDTVNISYAAMRFNFTGNSTSHVESKTLSDGSYDYYVRCRDGYSNEGAHAKVSFVLDTVAPQINSYSPAGPQTQAQQSLRITTNEPATCKWDVVAGEYDSMQYVFQNTGSTLHEHQITLTEGVNQFFAACKDASQNKNLRITFTAELNRAPSAKVVVDRPLGFEVLKPGTYLLTLTASENLIQAPALSLNCNTRIINVPLQGSGVSWNGYLIVPEEPMDCAAEFSFTGYDTKGTVGYEITEGKLILVDTIKPNAPTGIFAENQDGKVKIGWSHSGLEIKRYDVYRSTTGNTDKNGLKYSSTTTSYVDSAVQNKIGYFYRVVAVSHSGMESDLSTEAFVMAENPNLTVFRQSEEILAVVDAKIAELERIYSKIEVQENKYDAASPDELVVMEANDVLPKLEEARTGIQSMLGELRTTREIPITSNELNSRLLVIDSRMNVLLSKVFIGVTIKRKVSFEQSYNQTLFLAVMDEYLKVLQLSAGQKEKFIEAAEQLQESSRVTQTMIEYEVFYENAHSESGLIVVESILMPDAAKQRVVAQEVLPRGRIKLSEIDFQVEPQDINSYGPMWRVNSLPESRIMYKKQDSGGDLGVVTVLFPHIDAFLEGAVQNSSSQITGNVVSDEGSGPDWILYSTLALGLVLAGLLVYYAVSVFMTPGVSGETNLNPEDEYGKILQMIANSRAALDKNELHNATNLYNSAKDAFTRSKLGAVKKLKVNIELNTLYEDILIKSI